MHETQKERGMSAGYIGSNGVKFKDNLTEQKELTNKNINEFKKTVQTLNSEIFPLNAYTLISKILKEEAHLAGNDMCVVNIHTLIDRLRYQPYGDEVHSNNEIDFIFQKLYRGERLTETEQNLMMDSVHKEPRFDYITWWNTFTE